MKRIITIGLLLACSYTYGQSIQLLYDNEPLNSGDTIFIDVPSDNVYRDFPLTIVNTSSSNMELMARRTLISLLQGARNKFCLWICYDEAIDISVDDLLNAGDTLSPETDEYGHFHTSYNAEGKKGVSIIQFTFYDKNNMLGTQTSVYFQFDSESVGIKDNNISNTHHLSVYPNPTTGKLIINNEGLTIENIEIYDVVGRLLQSKIVNLQSEIVLDISHLANGIYYLKIDDFVYKIIKN